MNGRIKGVLLIRYLSLMASFFPFLLRLRYRILSRGPKTLQRLLDEVTTRMEIQLFQLSNRFVPPKYETGNALEVHTVICSRHVDYFIWAATCFQWSCGSAVFIVHDDGSLSNKDIASLQKNLGQESVRVVPRIEANLLVDSALHEYPACLRRRYFDAFGLKLFDVWMLAKADRIVVMDSDVLFLRSDKAWFRGHYLANGLIYNEEPNNYSHCSSQFCGDDAIKVGFNSGLMILDRSVMSLDDLERFSNRFFNGYFGEVKDWTDQLYYATLANRVMSIPFDRTVRLLPLEIRRVNNESVRAIHFHSCNKRYFAIMGIRYLLKYQRRAILRFLTGDAN